jgi:hypothetical protein
MIESYPVPPRSSSCPRSGPVPVEAMIDSDEDHDRGDRLGPRQESSPRRGNKSIAAGSRCAATPGLIAADPFGKVCHVPNSENKLGMLSPAVAVVGAVWRYPVKLVGGRFPRLSARRKTEFLIFILTFLIFTLK